MRRGRCRSRRYAGLPSRAGQVFGLHRWRVHCRKQLAARPALESTHGALGGRLPRPARLFAQPEKVEAIAELPDHPPRLFVWRNSRLRVVKADGPERIHGEWWVSEGETQLVRDYYRVETADGSRYWLFRDGPAGQADAVASRRG